jgi:hypothetical protein
MAINPKPTIRAELLADTVVAGRTRRIRWDEPDEGDAKGPGSWQRYIVLVMLGGAPDPLLPIAEIRVGLRCYGETQDDADALYGACSDALHGRGPRVGADGVGIYISDDETGPTPDTDVDTGQPLAYGVISLIATTIPVQA